MLLVVMVLVATICSGVKFFTMACLVALIVVPFWCWHHLKLAVMVVVVVIKLRQWFYSGSVGGSGCSSRMSN